MRFSVRSFRKRRIRQIFNIAAATPPVCLQQPLILDGFWFMTNPSRYNTTANMELKVYPGVWDETDGPVALTLEIIYAPTFSALSPTLDASVVDAYERLTHYPVTVDGFAGARGALVPSGVNGRRLMLRVRAERNGAVTYAYGGFTLIGAATPAPVFVGVTDQVNGYIGGPFAPGSTLTKPAYTWQSDPDMVPEGGLIISGSWWKNGVNTGVTAPTYSATADRDFVIWIETATDKYGSTGTMPAAMRASVLPTPNSANNQYIRYWRVINTQIATFVDATYTAVNSRTTGKPGGYTHMRAFSQKDPVNGSYTHNADLWCHDLRRQLSCVVAGMHNGRPDWMRRDAWPAVFHGWKNGGESGTLVTPRHLVMSGHFMPTANIADPSNTVFRFVRADGSFVEARGISRNNGGVPTSGGYSDTAIVTLDRDVAVLGIPPVPVINLSSGEYEEFYRLGMAPRVFARSQSAMDRMTEAQALATLTLPVHAPGQPQCTDLTHPHLVPDTGYPIWYDNMYYIGIANWGYRVWKQDSGTPIFVIVDDKLILYGLISGGCAPDFVDVNIALSDAAAVAAGHMDAPTGLTCQRLQLQDIAGYTVATPVHREAPEWFITNNVQVASGAPLLTAAPPAGSAAGALGATTSGVIRRGPEFHSGAWYYRVDLVDQAPPGPWVEASHISALPTP